MKPKVAFYWCASCGGCEEAVVDLAEGILPVLEAVEPVFWPVALDFKEQDVEAMEDGSIAISFINGAVRSTEQLEMARLMRRKSNLVVAFGVCAQLGGIPGLANLANREEILREAYGAATPKEAHRDNGHALMLPRLFDSVLPLDRAIPVDYYVPGCPPSTNVIQEAFGALLGDAPPPRGAILAPEHALCQDCPRRDTHPAELAVEQFRRVTDGPVDPDTCMLAQGILCLGPATRAGCGSRCIEGNMPCTGCFGPAGRAREHGAKALSATASILAAKEPEAIDRALDGLPDAVGLFYRYSLPASYLEHRRRE